MTDNASDYPGGIDPVPAVLEDDVDWVRADWLLWCANQAQAIQDVMGHDPQVVGGRDFGTIGAFLRAIFRAETGAHTSTSAYGGFDVTFTADRFKEAPLVFIEAAPTSQPLSDSTTAAVNITADGFTIGDGRGTGAAGMVYNWLAIDPFMGLEDLTE